MNKKGMGVIIILATIMLVLPMLGANTSHAKNITWRAASRSVPSHPGAMAVERFCKLVEERTDGALKIKFYPSEMLMPSRDQIAAVMRGTLEVANGSQSYDATAVPTINLVNMPFVGLTLQDWQPLMRPGGDLRIIMDQAYEDAGLKLLWMYPLGEQFVVTVDKPVLTVEDFKGLKLRTTVKLF
jgi:TRAP-type C4-dicarboxylate transport system substrate-binding protein